jgi:hypothetical protein
VVDGVVIDVEQVAARGELDQFGGARLVEALAQGADPDLEA